MSSLLFHFLRYHLLAVASSTARRKQMPFLLLGLVSIGWAGYSLVTGKGYYKGCPPGGYDRSEHPLNYWAPTLIILAIGICMLLVFFGLIHLPARPLPR
jgi:hypothetical protein